MSMQIRSVHHVQITVPAEALAATIAFYGDTLGFTQIARPANLSKGGAWFDCAGCQLHVSAEPLAAEANKISKRHLCYLVADLRGAESELRAAGVTILPDDNPVPGWDRFYVRDPGGNRIEIAQAEPGA